MSLQVALFDRIHSIRVKAIQEEYQRYMERVRTKAQNAIDQANTQYQQSRTMLTARVDTLVHYLQSRHMQVHLSFRVAYLNRKSQIPFAHCSLPCVDAVVYYVQSRHLQMGLLALCSAAAPRVVLPNTAAPAWRMPS